MSNKCAKKQECPGDDVLAKIREKYLKDQLEIIKVQMNSAMEKMHEYNNTNIQLIHDLKELKEKCKNLKEMFVDQKIDELHCFVNLTRVLEITRNERRRSKDNTVCVLQSKLSSTINTINDELDGLGERPPHEEVDEGGISAIGEQSINEE